MQVRNIYIIIFLLQKTINIVKSIKIYFVVLSVAASFIAAKVSAQSDFIPLGDKQYSFIERMDIKLVSDSVLRFTTTKPYNRMRVTQRLEYIDSLYKTEIGRAHV